MLYSMPKGFTFLQRKKAKLNAGFTLIELLVAISIVAILGTVGLVVYSSAQKGARISKRAEDLKSIQTAIELFKQSTGKYPVQSASFACVASLSGVNALAPSYMPSIPQDPLDLTPTGANCYQYQSDANGNEYKVKTSASLANTEMNWSNFNTQPNLLDPAHDANTGNGCTVDPLVADVANDGWALYSGTTACAY